ncbi:MAG TPA: hypothetical protein VFN97_07120 [Actinospica sp.]|nr:hypothetical protein [Actinospica sp.]
MRMRRFAVPLATCAVLATAPGAHAAAPAVTPPVVAYGVSGWSETDAALQSTLTAGEGLATVDPPGGTPYVLYRGAGSVPIGLAAAGWTHIGDPDSAAGYVIDPYQNANSSSIEKMFLVTTPSGATYQYVHTLVSGEIYNNSFDAISPDKQWMISGEWGTMSHLQIYPTPLLNPTTSQVGGPLGLSGYIQLDHKVNDVQGCDFVTATRLICASDDSTETLFSNDKPLLEVDLSAAPSGANVTGHVIDLGSIPQESVCSGGFEAEGVDYDPASGVLRVEIIQPSVCEVVTTVYQYKQSVS